MKVYQTKWVCQYGRLQKITIHLKLRMFVKIRSGDVHKTEDTRFFVRYPSWIHVLGIAWRKQNPFLPATMYTIKRHVKYTLTNCCMFNLRSRFIEMQWIIHLYIGKISTYCVNTWSAFEPAVYLRHQIPAVGVVMANSVGSPASHPKRRFLIFLAWQTKHTPVQVLKDKKSRLSFLWIVFYFISVKRQINYFWINSWCIFCMLSQFFTIRTL